LHRIDRERGALAEKIFLFWGRENGMRGRWKRKKG